LRVAIFGPTFPIRGGISHYTTILVEHLRKKHEVLFISYKKQYPDFLYPGRSQIDPSEVSLSTDCERIFSFTNPFSWFKAARRAFEFNPEIVLFSWVSPALAIQFRIISGLIKRKLPAAKIVFLCHNVAMHEERKIDIALSRFAFKHSDHFIVHGHESKDNLLRLVPDSTVSVVGLPTYEPLSRVSKEYKKNAREKLSIGDEDQVILFFGFVRPYKGLSYLLRAVPIALKEVRNLFVLVVGEFWEGKNEYEKLVEELGIGSIVRIIDRYVPNEELSLCFGASDVVVLPYTQASGSAIVQLAYGFDKPVITTMVGDIPEAVEQGKTGFLVEPENSESLAKAIVRFFSEKKAEEFRENIRQARERFSWDNLVRCIEQIAKG